MDCQRNKDASYSLIPRSVSSENPSPPPAFVLSEMVDRLELVEAFTPMAESCIWQLNLDYWRTRGRDAFLNDSVPYLVTSDGALASATAEMLAQDLFSRDRDAWPQTVTIVELGPGLGLFARSLLRRYAAIRESHPELPAVTYVGVDSAPAMLTNLAEMLEGVPGLDKLVLHEQAALSEPAALIRFFEEFLQPNARALCIANYLLDSIPATWVRREENALTECLLEVRKAPLEWAPGKESGDKPWSPVVRTRFQPCDAVDEVLETATADLEPGQSIPYPVGVIDLFSGLASLGADRLRGVLTNDYQLDVASKPVEPLQYFSGSVAVGIEFARLDRVCARHFNWEPMAPNTHSGLIVSRLYGRDMPSNAPLRDAFADAFSLDKTRKSHEWAALARSAVEAQDFGRALVCYETALCDSPPNWALYAEVARFVMVRLGNMDAALELANKALAENPLAITAMLTVGQIHAHANRLAEAKQTFEAIVSLDTRNVRAILWLSKCAIAEGDRISALRYVSEGLAIDSGGDIGGEFLSLQNELLGK